MILITIILGLILILILSAIVYIVIYFPTMWFIKSERLKTIRLTLSILIALLVIAFYLFVPTWSNNETATIKKVENHYQITMTGERALMSHDPISALKRETYTDTFKIIIPSTNGIIKGQEIPTKEGYYKMLGTVNIDKEKMNIDLYYDKSDDKTKDPLNWNGDYILKWKSN